MNGYQVLATLLILLAPSGMCATAGTGGIPPGDEDSIHGDGGDGGGGSM